MGNLGADPETRYTANGAINVQFSLAVSAPRRRNDTEDPPTIWYRCTVWGVLAERLDKLVQDGWVVKGRQLLVSGRLEPRQFVGNDGTTRWSFDVNSAEFELVGGGNRDDQGGGGQGSGGYNQNRGQQSRGQDSGNQQSGGFDDDPGPSNIDDVPF
jgi:single-strand DNA-binding protein